MPFKFNCYVENPFLEVVVLSYESDRVKIRFCAESFRQTLQSRSSEVINNRSGREYRPLYVKS
jgi:hypothetical protein